MKFQDYIDQVGAVAIARALRCTDAAVYKWRALQGVPRPETAYLLTVLSHGRLTLEDVYMPFILNALKGRKIKLVSFDGKSETQLQFKI